VRILIADNDAALRRLLSVTLTPAGHEVVQVADGEAAWAALDSADAPTLAVLDWVMPGLDGPEVCRRVRARAAAVAPYLILLTARDRVEDVVAGLEAGADDYIAKPFSPGELRARVQVGARVVALQRRLAERVAALEEALAQIRQLHGLLPICAWCKKIRNDQNYWTQVETYVSDHSGARFSHSICPECRVKHIEPELERIRQATATQRAADQAAP